MTSRENKVSWKNDERWFRENKVTRIMSVLQYASFFFFSYSCKPGQSESLIYELARLAGIGKS